MTRGVLSWRARYGRNRFDDMPRAPLEKAGHVMTRFQATLTAGILAAVLAVTGSATAAQAAHATSGSLTVDFDHQIATSSNLMFGLSSWPKLDPAYAGEIADAGVTIVRSDVYLYDIVPSRDVFDQSPAEWNWNPADPTETTTDGDVDAFRAAGLEHMLIIHGFPEWMGTEGSVPSWDGSDDSLPVTDFDALKEAYKQVFAHYWDRVDYFEIANEPDLEMSYDEYADIYRAALAGMNEVGTDTPVGPQSASADPDWYQQLLADPGIAPDVRFADWHSYGSTWNSDAGAWHDASDAAGRPDMPLFVTEWNHDPSFDADDPLDGDSPQAISYAGMRLSGMMDAGVTGAMLFGSNDETGSYDAYLRHQFRFIESDGTLTPKAATFRLLSRDMGLGVGENAIMNTADDGISASSSAVTATGRESAWAMNDSAATVTVSVTLTNLDETGTVRLTHYLAGPDDDATAPTRTETANVDGGTVTTTITMPPYSVYGLTVD